MKIEHQDILDQIYHSTLGDITFSRYDISTGIDNEKQLDLIIKEALQFLLLCHQSHLETLFASFEARQQFYLITMQFQDQSLCNLVIDGSPTNNKRFKKQIELVGTLGLYQFDSTDERGFGSNFILPGNYHPDYEEASFDNIWLSNLLHQIRESIEKKMIIRFGGNKP